MPEAEERYQEMQKKGIGAMEMAHHPASGTHPSTVANDDGDDLPHA
jgi:hypothetical protein